MVHRHLAAALLGAACLAAWPAAAESQSSNSSSNCSNGRCVRSDSLVVRDDRGRWHGWHHVEHWREGRPDRRWYGPAPRREDWRHAPPRRGRDDDDD